METSVSERPSLTTNIIQNEFSRWCKQCGGDRVFAIRQVSLAVDNLKKDHPLLDIKKAVDVIYESVGNEDDFKTAIESLRFDVTSTKISPKVKFVVAATKKSGLFSEWKKWHNKKNE
jgi:hypothetical protein